MGTLWSDGECPTSEDTLLRTGLPKQGDRKGDRKGGRREGREKKEGEK